MRTDLEALSQAGEKPLVILCPGKVDTEDAQEAQKWELLQEFLAQNAYEMKLDNGTIRFMNKNESSAVRSKKRTAKPLLGKKESTMEEKKLPFTGREKIRFNVPPFTGREYRICAPGSGKFRRSAETGNLPKGESLV